MGVGQLQTREVSTYNCIAMSKVFDLSPYLQLKPGNSPQKMLTEFKPNTCQQRRACQIFTF